MCGIAGFIGHSPENAPQQAIKNMLDSLQYRGPDDWGALITQETSSGPEPGFDFISHPNRVAIGHRRLSILDLSVKGHQPMANNTEDLWLIFNGEIYNYLELRQQLSHYEYRTTGDSEVILAAYETWGPEMLPKLEGMYSLVIWDLKKDMLFCARDPFGIKPFYYRQGSDYFAFASEPHAINLEFAKNPGVNVTSAADFLLLGLTDHTDETFFEGMKQLPGGCYMQVATDLSKVTQHTYWQPSRSTLDTQSISPGWLFDHLKHSVMLHMRSDVPVGGCLSGGIDSGSIAAISKELLGPEIANFNAITYSAPGFVDDETQLAGATADLTGVKWHQITTDGNSLQQDLDLLVKHMGEPFTSLSMYAQYKVMEKASELGLKVMLDGQGGDEMFLGYPRVANLVLTEYLRSFRFGAFYKEVKGFQKNASLSAFQQAGLNLFFNSPSLVKKRNFQRVNGILDRQWLELLNQQTLSDYFTKRDWQGAQVKELTKYVIPRLLRYEDRNSMRFSIEARVPFLSRYMADIGLGLPVYWQVRDGWTKYILRKSMETKLPEEVIWNPVKRGFDTPQQQWITAMRQDLIARVEGVSLQQSGGLLDISALSKQIAEGKAHYPYIWRCISFVLWLDGQKMSL